MIFYSKIADDAIFKKLDELLSPIKNWVVGLWKFGSNKTFNIGKNKQFTPLQINSLNKMLNNFVVSESI